MFNDWTGASGEIKLSIPRIMDPNLVRLKMQMAADGFKDQTSSTDTTHVNFDIFKVFSVKTLYGKG